MNTEEALARAEAADRIAERFDQWARRVLIAVAALVIIGTPAAVTTAAVLVHQSSTLDKQADALKADRQASVQRDIIVAQQRDLLNNQSRFAKSVADLLAATSQQQADEIRQQIGQEFGSGATTTTTTTTTPSSPTSKPTTSTTRPPSSTPSTAPPASPPSTSPPPSNPPPSSPPTTSPAPAAPPLPPVTVPGVVCLIVACPSTSRFAPFVTFGP